MKMCFRAKGESFECWFLIYDFTVVAASIFPGRSLLMLNCHAATSAAAVIWYVCASDMGIRIPVRASLMM